MMKFVDPKNVIEELKQFSPNNVVTKGVFEFEVPGLLEDMEWNHMDQMHRPFIHNTYQKGMRIALGKDFAVSLTQWQRIPLFITVTDIRIKPGLYYQCMTIAGLIYVHIHISMAEENEVVKSTLEWHITSHKWLKFLHKPLNKKLFKLNTRLQIEDNQIRTQRYALRKKGYQFASSPIDYYTSNHVKRNTIYPDMATHDNIIELNDLPENTLVTKTLGAVDFLIKKTDQHDYLIWPAACPHEGGNLIKGKECDKNQIQCPWHGLRFSAVVLSAHKPSAQGFGFEFYLKDDRVTINTFSKNTCSIDHQQVETLVGS